MSHPARWAGAYTLVAVMLASVFAFAILTGPYRAVRRSDYMTYHVAARIVVEARGRCLYTVACQTRVQRDLIGDEPSFANGALPFTSPPWLAGALVPLVPLSLPVAFAIFTILSLILLALAAWRVAWGGVGTRLVATALVLSSWPTVLGAIRGQSSLSVAAFVGLSAGSSLIDADTRAGAFAGLAAFKPTLVPLWGLRLIVERRWRALAVAAAIALILVFGSMVVVSPKAVAEYPAFLLNLSASTDTFGVHVEQMINWRGAAVRLAAGDLPVAAIGIALTLAAVAVSWWWARGSSRSPALGAASAFVATPLVIPHANQHEAILAALGVLVAVAAIEELRPQMAAMAIGAQAVLWVGPLLSGEASAWLLFAMLIAALLGLLWLSWRERARYFRRGPVPSVTD